MDAPAENEYYDEEYDPEEESPKKAVSPKKKIMSPKKKEFENQN